MSVATGVGCGAKTIDVFGGAGGEGSETTSTSSKSSSTSRSTSASVGATSGSTGSGLSCTGLLEAMTKARAEAQTCDASLDGPSPCTLIVAGPCCPVSLNPANAPAVTRYENLLAEYKARPMCEVACPAVPCLDVKVGKCLPDKGSPGRCDP